MESNNNNSGQSKKSGPNSLLFGIPCKRRTLFPSSADESNNLILQQQQQKPQPLFSAGGPVRSSGGDVPVEKRRKGLLSTPYAGRPFVTGGGITTNESTITGLSFGNANSGGKRPALLTPAGSEVKKLCAVTNPTSPRIIPTLLNSSLSLSSARRVLLPFSSPTNNNNSSSASGRGGPQRRSLMEGIISSNTNTNRQQKPKLQTADSVKQEVPSTKTASKTTTEPTETTTKSATTKLDKSTMTSGGEMDNDDLTSLHNQRAQIDRRIAELLNQQQQTGSSSSSNKKDMVSYVNGYYCHACRKFIRGDYAAKIAHCAESAHKFNSEEDSCNNDPETVLKYFEEKYEGMAFDEEEMMEEGAAATNRSGTGPLAGQPKSASVSGSSLDQQQQQVVLVNLESDDNEEQQKMDDREEEEEDEEEDPGSGGNKKEPRFDRTRISSR